MVLRGIEQKIEALFEGVFGRAFRTNVQPVELARKLVEGDGRPPRRSRSRASTSRTSTRSTSRPATGSSSRATRTRSLSELEEYLTEHARRESYALLTPPRVKLETDDDLALGEFGIATRMVQPRHGHAKRRARRAGRARGDHDLQAPRRGRDRGRVARGCRARARGRRSHVGRPAPARRQAPRRHRPLARVRHPDRGRERLAPPRRAAPGGDELLDRRPRLDERPRGERAAPQARRSSSRATHSRSGRPR